MIETILCAAVLIEDGSFHSEQPTNVKSGFVICGRRHSDCFVVMKNIARKMFFIEPDNFGFITSKNRFLNRKEAFWVAKAANQIQGYNPEMDKEPHLISENLY